MPHEMRRRPQSRGAQFGLYARNGEVNVTESRRDGFIDLVGKWTVVNGILRLSWSVLEEEPTYTRESDDGQDHGCKPGPKKVTVISVQIEEYLSA
jgi:hypothetical protein